MAKKYSGAKKGDFGVFQWIHPAENGKSVRERGQNRDRGLKKKKKGINGKKWDKGKGNKDGNGINNKKRDKKWIKI